VAAVLAVLAPCMVTGCTGPHPAPPPPYTLRVLADSELAGMQPILAQATAATGVNVSLIMTDTLTLANDMTDGTAQRDYDAVWLASADYLDLYARGPNPLVGTTPIMSSPVILAMRTPAARRLGWDHGSVTWLDIARAAAAGRFRFGMSSPVTSDSGLSALVGAATAVAGRGAALTDAGARQATSELAGLFAGQRLTATTSGALAQMYLDGLASSRSAADGVIGYEADLLALQARAPRGDPLTLVYPSDGEISATYPLSLVVTASRAATEAFFRLVGYLTSKSEQDEIMMATGHRPVLGSVRLARDLPGHLAALRFPANPQIATDLIGEYLGKLRPPGRTVYVLDTSASMRGARLSHLEQALRALTGAGHTLADEFSEFRSGEEITFLPFSYGPATPTVFSIRAGDPRPALAGIRDYIGGLKAHGRTAIYDALVRAYQIMAAEQDREDSGRIDAIVLMTDGENDWGRTLGVFLAYYRSLPLSSPAPPVYAIAFGEADISELTQVASATGGTVIDAVRQPLSVLSGIVEDVRGYQ
jgi:Ca-activated chloride channel family protein